MSEKIKKFFECLIPVSACNLRCEYCYVIQEKRRKNENPDLKYSPEYIAKALSKERLGGTSYISICGAGETLLAKNIIELVFQLLKEGHYVNITTNGTLTEKFKKIAEFPKEYLERLHFAFSFHYLELKKINLINTFFKNVNMIKNAGCSFLVQFNLYDGYIPYLEEIKKLCLENVGALPQVALTRNELTEEMTIMSNKTNKEYKKIGEQFNSPLFDFTYKNFMQKRNEFCYAGDWACVLNLLTGDLRKCYASSIIDNIFDDINRPIKWEAVGCNCKSPYCINSSHFMSLGVIPSLRTPSYCSLRNRKNVSWYNDKMLNFLNSKLCESNKEYSEEKKKEINNLNKISLFKKIKYKILSKISLTHKKRKHYRNKLK